MSYQVACPHCNAVLEVDPAMTGQEMSCGACGGVFLVPQLASPENPWPAEASPGQESIGQPWSSWGHPVPGTQDPWAGASPPQSVPPGPAGAQGPEPLAPPAPPPPVPDHSPVAASGHAAPAAPRPTIRRSSAPPRKLSREEKEALRRRRNLIFLIGGFLFLVIVLLLLVHLSGG